MAAFAWHASGDRQLFVPFSISKKTKWPNQHKVRVVAGPDAIHSYLNAKTPGRLIQSTKSYLASRLFNHTQIFSETYSLEELIGILLRNLRKAR